MATTATPATNKIDWAGIATNAMNMAIVVIGNKIQGIQTPAGTVKTGAGINVSGSGVSLWSSQNLLPAVLIGTAVIALAMVFKR